MPLHLITGLPNTGRTEILREEFEEAARAGRNPILLVPSVDDVFAWERRLTRPRDGAVDSPRGGVSALSSPAGGFAGGVVMHFNDLCREIVRRADGASPRIAGEMRRRLALERAVAKLADGSDGPAARIEGKTKNQPGLLDAALELVDEYRAERIEAGDPFRSTTEPAQGEEVTSETIEEIRRGIEPLVAEFETDLASDGLTDLPQIAQRALEVVVGLFGDEADWRGRPIFVAGFDDMTGQQLELLRKLSNDADVEVRMAVTWKEEGPGRGFLTDRLMARLKERLGLAGDPDRTGEDPRSGSLFSQLAEAFLAAEPNRKLDANPPVTMIRTAGERREAEVIGAEIARLLSDGKALPDEIAVAHTDPGVGGRLLEGVLRRYGIPVTLETETGALSTSIGAALAALLRASGPDGTADDLILWLRGPLGPGLQKVDDVERKCRRRGIGTAQQAFRLIPGGDRGKWAKLLDEEGPGDAEVLELIGELAREAGQKILRDATSPGPGKGGGARPDPEVELEVRMAETLADSAKDLASADADGLSDATLMLEAIRRGEVAVWTVPTQGTVRITGLWAMRAKRVRYLFVAGLQEGGTRDLSRAGPFLSTAERRGLGMLERVDPEVQARYLLFSCLNVPTEAIWLSCTTSDDVGNSTAPSPLLGELVSLCPDPLPLIERSGSDVAFSPSSAPTMPELVRSLVVEDGDPGSLGLDRKSTVELAESIRRAKALEERSREFDDFEDPGTKAALADLASFSPSEIEAWLACQWTWLIDRKIRPEPFSPDATYLISGTFIHKVLERLYREMPAGGPKPETVNEWLERVPATFQEVLDEKPDSPLSGDEPAVRLARFTLERMVRSFLQRESTQANPEFIPVLFEQRFRRPDPDEEADSDVRDEVEMEGWHLKGAIDRVDTRGVSEEGEGVDALVIDYKTGSVDASFSPDKLDEKGRVQIPLYMEAIRRALGLRPVAGFVLPLKEGADSRPRGPIPSGQPDVVGLRGHVGTDLVDSTDDFIEQALTMANRAVAEIREGSISHKPEECRRHFEDPDGLLPEASSLPAPEVLTEPILGDESATIGPEEVGSPPQWSPEQESLIDSRARDIMVAAAAGSGKTSVTVERYRKLLEDPDLEPDRILVFTFTDKAAAKLREEVRGTRSREAGGAVSMSDAWVGTFHSICSRILTAWPIEAGVDPGFNVIDDISSTNLRDEAFDWALRSRLQTDDDEDPDALDGRMAVLSQVREGTLKKGIFSVFDLLRSRGEEYPRLDLTGEPPIYPEKKLRDLSGRIEKALDRDGISRFSDSQKDKCREIRSLVESEREEPIRASEIRAQRFDNADLEDKTGIPSLREEVERELIEFEGHPWLVEFDRILAAFGERYAALKEARSGLDYEDLQIKALNLLLENEAVRNEYGSRFEEIMVDEFQDTNQLQMKLIDALRGDGGARLMTVGDEMQAIYRFRHADVGIFRERALLLGAGGTNGELIELPTNYRSDPPIIEAVNEIGQTIHGSGNGDDGAPAFRSLVPGKDSGSTGAGTTLLLTPEKGWEGVDLGPLCPAESDQTEHDRAAVAEALAVASGIRDLIDSGDYSQSDVAILLRATTGLDNFRNALTRFGLRSVVPSSRGFWSSRPVLQLIGLLSVVANPLDDRALTAALTSPACGLGPDGLWKVREAAGPNSALWEGVTHLTHDLDAPETPGVGPGGDEAALAGFRRAIEETRSRLGRTSLESIVTGLLDSTGLDLASLVRDRTSLASLERVATLAGEYESQEGRDLRGFLDWAASSREAEAEAAVAGSSEHDDAMKIMTIHKAKGLEFPVVCVPDLGRELGRPLKGPVALDFDGEGGEMRIGLQIPNTNQKVFDWPGIEEAADRETEAEELRLIHVAMTRAEERLILSGRVKAAGDGNPRRRPAINRILAPFNLDFDEPEGWAEAILESGRTDALSVETSLPGDEENRERLVRSFPLVLQTRTIETASPPLTRPERAFFPDVPLSFSGLVEFRECPTRFFARRVLRMEVEGRAGQWSGPEKTGLTERDGGTKFGTAVHELLEESAANGWKSPDPTRVEAALEAERVDSEGDGAPEKAAGMITAFLESDLGEKVRKSPTAATAELPIVLGIGGVTIRGFVDLVVEEDGKSTVVDYKTNQLNGRAPEELMEGYELQRDLYALAVARARNLDSIETAFVFLERADSPVVRSYGPADLEAVEERLRKEVVEPITNARYFGGEGDGPDPCGKCEACRLLGLGSS